MLGIKTGLSVALLSLALNSAGAVGCGTKQNNTMPQETTQNMKQGRGKKGPIQTAPGRNENTMDGDLKILAEGGYSRVADAFMAVARDAETYAALHDLGAEVPPLAADFFQTNAVIAAFLGVRRTGGYGIAITRTSTGSVQIAESSPPAGAMLTQVITSPFKIVSVPVSADRLLPIEIDDLWKAGMRPYHVTAGEFTTGGGLTGRLEKLKLEGDFRLVRYHKLVTFAFSLKSTGGAKERALQELATGVVQEDGRIKITQLDAGSLVDSPHEPLRATGQFTGQEDHLSLEFQSLPTRIADGYSGQGKLEAVATAPPPQRRKPGLMEEPL